MSDLKFADTHNLVAFLEKPTESEGFEEIDTVKAKTINGEVQLQALVDKKKVIITESTLRRDLQLEDANGVNCLPNATIFKELTRIGKQKRKDTELPQSSGPTEPIADEAANEENVPTHSNDPLLSGEDSLKLNELMELCTNLQKKVLDLETSKTTQALEIKSLKRRVKKLEKKQRSKTYKLRRLYKVGLSAKVVSSDDEASLGDQEDASKQGRKILDIDADEDITLDSTHFDTDPDMFGVHDLHGDEVFVETEEPVVNAATTTTTIATTTVADEVEMTLAQTLIEIKSAKPKAKGIVMQEPSKSTPTNNHHRLRIKVQRIRDKVETDYELAQRLQQEEQEELTTEEKSKLFQQLLEKRRKFFAAKRAEKKRNRPPTKAQQRSIMFTYLKNMEGWKPKDLKNKSFANIQELFEKEMKKVNTFVDFRTELVEGTKKEESSKRDETIGQESSSKRTGDELEQDKANKQKIDDDQEETKMKELMEVVYDEEGVAIDAIPLSTKPPSIVDYKIIKEGKISNYQIIRVDRSSKRYSAVIHMLRNFNKEDLKTLWKIVKARHGYTRPEEGYERVL
ncbi:hypothetical protein Tco_0256377 [Tanacetum coccineum]